MSRDPKAAALGINWQIFGSNGQETADYTRGVLERFTRRAPSDWVISKGNNSNIGNIYIKSVVNPRLVDYFVSPHYAFYFNDFKSINSDGTETFGAGNHPICSDKIVINHYFTKSKEEYATKKMPKGSIAVKENYYDMEGFYQHDRNDIFDDNILKYRATRAESFSPETNAEKFRRMENALLENLMPCSPLDAPDEFFVGKLETFLTCRAVAEKLGTKIDSLSAEEYALAWIYQTFNKDNVLTYADLQLFISVLPDILSRPFKIVKSIVKIFAKRFLPAMIEINKSNVSWYDVKVQNYLRRLLNSI